MPIHDWTRVSAGSFHDFHSVWIGTLRTVLNRDLLPDGFYALAEQHAGQITADVLTLREDKSQHDPHPEGPLVVANAPPKVSLTMVADEASTYRAARRTLTIRHSSDHEVVAMIEIVSPSNKDRRQSVDDFVDKAIAAIRHRIHLLVIDLFPPSRHDEAGMHGAIWSQLTGQNYSMPKDKPLTLSALVAESVPQAYVEPMAIGDSLTAMPLFLTCGTYLEVPLDETYMAAYEGVPSILQDELEQ